MNWFPDNYEKLKNVSTSHYYTPSKEKFSDLELDKYYVIKVSQNIFFIRILIKKDKILLISFINPSDFNEFRNIWIPPSLVIDIIYDDVTNECKQIKRDFSIDKVIASDT